MSDRILAPLRTALIGCGGRARDYHAPLLTQLPDFELVACASRTLASATALAEPRGLPAYDDLSTMLDRHEIDLAVLCVPYHSNGEMGLELVRRGISYLGETPVAHRLSDGDLIVREAEERGVIVGIAEQFPHFPIDALTGALVESGAFGRVLHAASDFAGHGYHGTALIRHLIGRGAVPTQALGIQRDFAVQPHYSRIDGRFGRDQERWDFGTLEFEGGAFGSFLFTTHGYDSPMRWHRQTRLFGERGMAVNGDFALISEDGRERHALPVQWNTHEVEGQAVVRELTVQLPPWASTDGAERAITWRNPCPQLALRDDEIAVASCLLEMAAAVRAGKPPRYDAAQGLLDQECTLAMERSHERGGAPCPFPLER